eukprot:16195123-Heterocapsa_arctica.AAC.1
MDLGRPGKLLCSRATSEYREASWSLGCARCRVCSPKCNEDVCCRACQGGRWLSASAPNRSGDGGGRTALR